MYIVVLKYPCMFLVRKNDSFEVVFDMKLILHMKS